MGAGASTSHFLAEEVAILTDFSGEIGWPYDSEKWCVSRTWRGGCWAGAAEPASAPAAAQRSAAAVPPAHRCFIITLHSPCPLPALQADAA